MKRRMERRLARKKAKNLTKTILIQPPRTFMGIFQDTITPARFSMNVLLRKIMQLRERKRKRRKRKPRKRKPRKRKPQNWAKKILLRLKMKKKMERRLVRKRPKSLTKISLIQSRRRKKTKKMLRKRAKKKPKRCEKMYLISLLYYNILYLRSFDLKSISLLL
jgi:hypothetical protein